MPGLGLEPKDSGWPCCLLRVTLKRSLRKSNQPVVFVTLSSCLSHGAEDNAEALTGSGQGKIPCGPEEGIPSVPPCRSQAVVCQLAWNKIQSGNTQRLWRLKEERKLSSAPLTPAGVRPSLHLGSREQEA